MTLSPTERAVYLLREVFDYEFEEVARVVKKSEANCRQLLRDVDSHRTPADAASATDATGRAELVVPRSELVRQPLAVTRTSGRPDTAAVDVRMVDGVAGVPEPNVFGLLAGSWDDEILQSELRDAERWLSDPAELQSLLTAEDYAKLAGGIH